MSLLIVRCMECKKEFNQGIKYTKRFCSGSCKNKYHGRKNYQKGGRPSTINRQLIVNILESNPSSLSDIIEITGMKRGSLMTTISRLRKDGIMIKSRIRKEYYIE